MNLVIDENVLVSAATIRNPSTSSNWKDQEQYPWSINVLSDVIGCNHKLLVTPAIVKKYERKFTEINKGHFGPVIFNIAQFYSQAMDLGKVKYKDESLTEKRIHKDDLVKLDDKPFARLAKNTMSILVSLDGPLKLALGDVVKEPYELVDTKRYKRVESQASTN
jgi:hypothetical protein